MESVPTLKITAVSTRVHERGRVYNATVDGKTVSILFTFHALGRMRRWKLTDRQVLRALLFAEEVLRGHRGRFLAHIAEWDDM